MVTAEDEQALQQAMEKQRRVKPIIRHIQSPRHAGFSEKFLLDEPVSYG